MKGKESFTLLPLWMLAKRELVRFYRQRSRVIGALLTPVVFWLFLGSGLGAAFPAPPTPGGKGFLEFFFPGNIVLTLLFSSIFSTISIIEDRNEGFLQSVLVAPVSRTGLVAGKVLGGAILSMIQGTLFLLLAPTAGFSLGVPTLLFSLLSMFAMSVALTSLGFIFAWHFNSMQGFHAVMNVLLFPMWLLSGAFFPVSHAPVWLKPVMYVNPLSYGLASLRGALYGNISLPLEGLPSYWLSILMTLTFAILFYFICLGVVAARPKEIPS